MKSIAIFICLTFLLGFKVSAQDADKLLGYWLTQEGDSQVEIFKAKNGKYFGEIRWLKDPTEEDGTPKVDKHNPDNNLKNKPVLGLQLLKDFKYDEDDKEWEKGTIYDPKNGKTYKCYIWFEEGDDITLHVKGFIGISLLGREVEWKREQSLRK